MTMRTRTKTALAEMLGGKQLEPEIVLDFFAGELPGYENLECYIYRLKPKPPDRPRETPSYLWKMQTPFSLEDIKTRFGGGVFKCIANSLSEKDPVTNHRLNKANFLFEIDGPPIFSPDLRAAAPNVLVMPGPTQPPRAPGFTIAGLQLTELKLLKELLAPSPVNPSNLGAEMLGVFLKGVEFAKGIDRGSEPTSELDLVREIVKLFQKDAAASGDNGFIVSPGTAPAAAVAPAAPDKGQVQMNLDNLLNFLMDCHEEGKLPEETAAGVLVMVPSPYLGQIFSNPDSLIVASLKGWMSGYDFWETEAAAKEAWLAEVVAAVRKKRA